MALIIFGCLAFLAAALLLAPVRVQVAFGRDHKWARISYIGTSALWDQQKRQTQYSLLGLRLRTRPWGTSGTEHMKQPRRPRERAPQQHRRRAPNVLSRARLLWVHRVVVLRTVRVVARLIGRLAGSLHLESGRLDIYFRSPDPAVTGAATGAFWATCASRKRRWHRLDLSWNPDFTPGSTRTELSLEGAFTWRIIPVEPLAAVLRALGSMPWRRLYRLKRAWSH